MELLEYLDRVGQRRLERERMSPKRPLDVRMLVGTLFFVGYYVLLWRLMSVRGIPADNVGLIKDAMLVLGPIVGVIAQALFRSDVKDEIATQNTGEFARASAKQAEATIAAAATSPASTGADQAASQVADAAVEEADRIRGENQ